MPEKKAFERLPTNVVPVNYQVTLTPNLTEFTFKGSEIVDIEVKESTDCIIINCVDIEVQEAKFSSQSQDLPAVATIDNDAETLTLKFSTPLSVGSGKLSITFTGCLNDKMKGFYRSKYKGPDGEDRFAAVTQFESTDARRALPCWDEPAIKATFEVTLVVPKDRVALSNMPVIRETEEEGGSLNSVTFDRTPVMSSYLLAFIVGEYDYVEDKDSDGVLIRVYTPVGKKQQGVFALQVATKTLPFYKDYFSIAYPLPKMDLIALADFASGAMENWGLVTYRETALLVDEENSSSSAKQWVALVVGHELAHQWFGNLVTMEWWTHLWLNEGFASFIEYLCVDLCFPEYDIWTQFVNQDLARALELDALKSSHPIEVPVGHPEEVDEIFDAISYSKGASVIRMLHGWIGDQAFRKGLNHYLTKFAYKNTFTEDLWDSLQLASGKPVREVMSTWTSQMGFPVLKVQQKQEGDNRVLNVSQSKFCADGKSCEGDYLWQVPINVVSSANPSEIIYSDVLSSQSAVFTIPNVKSSDWIKLNPDTIGVYRTQYSKDMLESLLPAIEQMRLPARDRLGLQNDLFALARAGLSSTVDILKVAMAFRSETDYTVWKDLVMNLSVIGTLTEYTDYHQLYKDFTIRLFSDVAQKMGWTKQPGEKPTDSMLRTLVISKLAQAGHKPTVEECLNRFQQHFTGTSLLDADLRAPVYGAVIKHGDLAQFDQMFQIYDRADMSEEKVRVLRTLGLAGDESKLKRVLDFTISDKVRPQDVVYCIMGVSCSALGRKLAWEFLQANWDSKFKVMFPGGYLLTHLIKDTIENFTDTAIIPEITKFFEKNPVPSANRAIQQACENIELNAAMLERDRVAMKEYFTSESSAQ